MIAPARKAAYTVLRSIATGRIDLPSALAGARQALGDERDRALTDEIALGSIRWRGAIDYLIEQFASRPLDRLDPEIQDILRLSIYQLLHLERVPAAAVVDDAVKLAGWSKKRSAGGMVNAVLREVSRNRHRLPLPDRSAGVDYLAVTLSHPRWLVSRWHDRHGFDATEAWARFNNTAAPLTIRANTLWNSRDELAEALAREHIAAQPTRHAPQGLVVVRGNPLNTHLAATGRFAAQDESSQLIAAFAAPRPGETVLDTCASPGGKTTAMAAAMEDHGLLVAADLRPNRVRLLAQTVGTSGAKAIRIVRLDLEQTLPFGERFDCVVVDAPCSGLGAIRRDPDIKWRREESDLARLASAQRVMLANAGHAVKRGGRLIYSTCSSEPEENEQIVEAFLATRHDFERRPPADGWLSLSSGLKPVIDEQGYLHPYPHVHGLEPFFAAWLVRKL
jgi:16S rRNA (cytosine967-C5)-methyltransferase